MNLVLEFWRAHSLKLESLLEATDTAYLVKDSSGYVYVDGEEGDYGVVRYYCPITKELVATHTIHGGDNEEYEFTEYGKKLLGHLVLSAMKGVLWP